MVPGEGVAVPAYNPGIRMASWSFYLGLLGFLAMVLNPVVRAWPLLQSVFIFGGLALGVIAIVLGLAGLGSVNRVSAFAGLLFGMLAVGVFFYFGGHIMPSGLRP